MAMALITEHHHSTLSAYCACEVPLSPAAFVSLRTSWTQTSFKSFFVKKVAWGEKTENPDKGLHIRDRICVKKAHFSKYRRR